MSPLFFITLILIGLLGSAFFSGTEIAIISCNRLRMHNLARSGDRAARTVEGFLDNRRRMVTATLIGTNFFNVGAAAAATGLFTILAPGPGAILSTLVVTPLILVFGEIVPKAFFRQYAEGVCLRIAPLLQVVYRLLSPLVLIADGAATLFLGLTGTRPSGRISYVSREELLLLVGEGERLGLLRADGRQMIHRAFTLSETQVRNIMVPLVDICALSEETTIEEALPQVAEWEHSRIPIYRGRVDNIVGLLYVFDLLEHSGEGSIEEVMHPAYYVPESKGLQQLLLEMKQSRVHMAVAVDEYGGASGIVTLEDTLEKIVGEIRDEYDRESPHIVTGREEWTILDARTPLSEARRAAILLPPGDYETVGGFLISRLGRIPEAGELHQLDGWEIEVLEATPQRVGRLRMRPRPGGGTGPGGEGPVRGLA
jgi:putative hemolysin